MTAITSNKIIVFLRNDVDGAIAFMEVLGDEGDNFTSIEDLAEKTMEKLPQCTSYNIIDKSELPTDRTFRDAWTWE